MKESRLDTWQEFITYEKSRETMKLSSKISAMMDYCEYILHVEFDKNMKSKQKSKRNKQELTEEYREAFKTLNRDEKLSYYLLFMKCITLLVNGKVDCGPKEVKGVFCSDVYSRSFNLKIWKHKKMRLDREKGILYAEKDNKIKTYILSDYLLRRSKTKEFYCFVLEAVNKSPHEKSRTVHLGFKEETKFTDWLRELQEIFKILAWKLIESEIKNNPEGNVLDSSDYMRSSDIMSDRTIKNKMEKEETTEMAKSYVFESSSSIGDEEFQKIKEELRNREQSSPEFSSKLEEEFFSGNSSDEEEESKNKNEKRKSITEEIGNMDIDELEALNSKHEENVGKQDEAKENIFHRLMPKFNLQTLSSCLNYANLFEEGKLKIVASLDNPAKLKMFIQLEEESHRKAVLNVLTEPETFKRLNSEVDELSLKTLIKSENSALMYLKIKAYNKLYRPRDFVFLRHVFNTNKNTYIIDKSIENLQYPPFTTIVRGQFCTVWGIVKENNQNMLVAEILMKNEGYLNDSQNVNLILKYLKGFSKINQILHESKAVLENFNLFNDLWDIVEEKTEIEKIKLLEENDEKEKEVMSESSPSKEENLFKKVKIDSSSSPEKNKTQEPSKESENKSKESNNNKIFDEELLQKKVSEQEKEMELKKKYSHMEEEKGEISANEAEDIEKLNSTMMNGVKRDFDSSGNVIINNKFIQTKFLLSPLPKSKPNFQDPIKGHPIWKGEWKRDEKTGPIIFIDKKKIEDQKGVLKFILSKIGKNIMSGKSVLNISLPVDIFCAESNLERFLYSFTYAPTIIEPIVSNKNNIERLKKVIVFGLSNSILYLNMEKPFNPILGETFQCWIDGCPSYAEQISHHPPVAALLFEGRGFRVTAQLESKVELHMNSGCGTNDGVFKVKFDDGIQISFSSPGGEVSGLVYGDRKFNIVGKAYYWIESENIFLEIVFNPTRKGFFSVGKQEQPIDYFEGQICKVKPEFMEAFLKKRKSPIDKDILEKLGKIHGIWNKEILYEEETLINLEKDYPVKLEYEANPLPSDANWREDIAYRRIREISKAQSEKERLEVLQRKDRKLRESNPHHSHKK